MLEESELLIFRRPPSASLAAVGEPYSSAVGLLMEDPKSPPEKGGPGAGDAAGRLKDKRRSVWGIGSRQDDAGPTRVCHELSVEPLSSV